MIRILNAYTRELDDARIAVAEVLTRLDMEKRLLRNSVGILAFPPEFLETNVVESVCAALPFDSIGGTTSNAAVAGVMGELGEPILAVTVLTSDDVTFRAGVSGPIGDDARAPIRELYSRLAPPAEIPSLLLTLAPVIEHVGGDDFIEALDAVSGETSLFGALVSCNHPEDFKRAVTCWNGHPHADALVLIALFGNVDPDFHMSFIPDNRVLRQKSVVTQSTRNRIQEINGLVPLDYLKAIGLAENGNIVGMSSIPFVLTLSDGSRVVRSVYKTTEEGHVLSFGTIPQGARIGFSNCSGDFIVRSARETIARIIAARAGRNALILSCNARQWTIGAKADTELKEVVKNIGDSFAYQFAYSVGEICPVRNQAGRLVNRFHNFSLIVCLL